MASNTEMMESNKMCPNESWTESLITAPSSVSIMGGLVYVSSGNDFSINPPPKGFHYVQYPNSFMACLMQVCNSSWRAFNLAHKNMDQIRIHTVSVPKYMNTTVRIFSQGSDKIVETLLPRQLETIQTVAKQCLTLAEGVEKKYSDVIELIMELLEACASNKCIYEQNLKDVETKLEIAKQKKKNSEEWDVKFKRDLETLSTDLEKGETEYQKSLDSLPSNWEMLGMDFVEGITSPLQSIRKLFTGGKTAGDRAAEHSKARVKQSVEYLKTKRESYEQYEKKLKDNQKELDDILKELYGCQVETVEFDSVIKLLTKGMEALGKAQQQWQKIVRLFQTVSSIVSLIFSKTLSDFVKLSDDAKNLSGKDKDFVKELLYEQATDACNIASMVHMISGTYTEVSNKYLMNGVSSLSSLLAMDKKSEEFKEQCKQLKDFCKGAEDDINQMIMKNQEFFQNNLKGGTQAEEKIKAISD